MMNDAVKVISQPYWLKVIVLLIILSTIYAGYPLVFDTKAEYLSTDLLIYLLVCSFIVFVSYIRQQPHLSEPWKDVFKNKIAMASAVVLFFFIVVGLMDSIHFRIADTPNPGDKSESIVEVSASEVTYSADMVSLLDVSLNYFSSNHEKTYSAPFSIYSYAKENYINENGIKYRDYPRLKHAGAHLNTDKDFILDLLTKSFVGILLGVLIAIIVTGITLIILNKGKAGTYSHALRTLIKDDFELPWRVMLLTSAVIIIFFSILLYLSSFYHVMGTDKVGQDVFYLTLKSIRTGLVIGTLTTLIMLPFAIALGVMAGYYKGIVDDIIQYIYTTLNSIPGILLIVAVMLAIDVYIENHAEFFETAIERADIKLLALCAVLGITSWTGLCRLLRGEVFKLRELEYIQAARSLGVSDSKIIISHIVPNVMHIVLIVVVLDFSGLVLAEAVLAYIGVGVDPSTISWGNMINSARLELSREPVVWWSLISAFSFMFALVLAANLFSDAIRDAFDPRMQGIK